MAKEKNAAKAKSPAKAKNSAKAPAKGPAKAAADRGPKSPAVVVLAAGKGTRMKSDLPKVLRPVMGRPIITHVLNAARYLAPARLVVVTGHGAEAVEREIAPFGPICLRQEVPRGTGDAVRVAAEGLEGFDGPVVILPGDVPLISPQTLLDLLDAHAALGRLISVLTVRLADPASYGRVIRDKNGWLERIVEARDANDEELSIDEINSGVYVADCATLIENVFNLKPDNAQNEYYLTDVVAEFRAKGHLAAAIQGPDPLEVQGVNDCRELARAQAILRGRINESWLLAGVAMDDPATTHIEASVKIGRDVTLGPGVVMTGNTKVGAGASLGPYCCLRNAEVAPGTILPPHRYFSDAFVDSKSIDLAGDAPKKTTKSSLGAGSGGPADRKPAKPATAKATGSVAKKPRHK
ncbi:MAG: NTP transferase domain-containing protein [Deltaproteobacteria bacterium]|jgi:bifunctional UDP-N-acetylglucosamine pyrophosphorylase/glucosamine-1-phosphate N-acetyltransferase|nr:NTP transferase domain-containing protein [Deltaproteobacteria bacterium]